MTRGEFLAFEISLALSNAQKVVRGLWKGLTEQERHAVARRVVDRLKEHGDKWKLDEEFDAPPIEAHSTPKSFTEAHNYKKDG